ncbi:MAG TPA: phosphohydrolase, partial [Streptosporangiaceae bacterium]|nr:phosphohydrolase [Streptosporangiaceae bacterium]
MTGETIARRPATDRMAYWQALDSGRILLMVASAMLVLAAFAGVVAMNHNHTHTHSVNWRLALAFGAFIAFGELLRLALPGGRESAPIAMVGAMAYALLLEVPSRHGPHFVSYNALLVIAVSAVGMTLGALPHIAAGRPAGLTGMCGRLVAVSCVAFVFRSLVTQWFVDLPWEVVCTVVTLAFLLGWLIDTLIGALIRADDVGARFAVAVRDELRLQWPLGLAVGASVLIAVFGTEEIGIMELAVFIGPLLVTQVAFRRYAGIRATYLQTVRSLARVTEVA